MSWHDAWLAAATGPDGFWQRERPARHFRTAAAATGSLALMVRAALSDRPDIATVVDIGCGDGRLLADLAALAPQLRLIGVDLRPATAELRPGSAERIAGYWDVVTTAWKPNRPAHPEPVPLSIVLPTGEPMAIICAEWLDDLPAVVAERSPDGWRSVLVGADGRESLGGPVSRPNAGWLDRWWPADVGQRAESGLTRDAAWSAVLDCLRPAGGLAVMVDYGHRRTDRPLDGSLTGYRRGQQVAPYPSTAVNLTAHVAVDSVAAAGEAVGGRTELFDRQRSVVERLLPDPGSRKESDILARLQQRSERRLLTDRLGDHWWLVQSVAAAQAPARCAATGSPAEAPETTRRAGPR